MLPFFVVNQTKNGDILDCVEINKQFAFDNPLLRNHTIQMKPNFKVSKQTTSTARSFTILSPSQLLPKSIRCPRGTVVVRRIQEVELIAMDKFSPLLGTTTFSTTNKSSHSTTPDEELLPGYQIANLVASTNNVGVSAVINVWTPDVITEEFSEVSAFVATDDGAASNVIQVGWLVHPMLYQNTTRLYAYWTKDSGKSTGCFNGFCPGFVQVSQETPLGVALTPVSTYSGRQYFMAITIQQDKDTKNWWVLIGDKQIGYYPKELFSTMANGATRGGWGGEIYSISTHASPPMGNGHFPEEGYSKSCLISRLNLVGQDFPNNTSLRVGSSIPDCYKAIYNGDVGGDFGHNMFVGGPANCWE
ncbi:uncharacterized protein [Spinacia oleracea]|uniref:Neprosin PEP catalytic domain-containing protein n=1 Tax=Spinacia oleracea TaxID=3562 RepID=A0ABM3QZU9_SPIOL|nr:uncharacterized protein LOC110788303 [Spinacia oleracea]